MADEDYPQSKGRIVIPMPAKRDFRKKEKEILGVLISKGVNRKRLETKLVEGDDSVVLWNLL